MNGKVLSVHIKKMHKTPPQIAMSSKVLQSKKSTDELIQWSNIAREYSDVSHMQLTFQPKTEFVIKGRNSLLKRNDHKTTNSIVIKKTTHIPLFQTVKSERNYNSNPSQPTKKAKQKPNKVPIRLYSARTQRNNKIDIDSLLIRNEMDFGVPSDVIKVII